MRYKALLAILLLWSGNAWANSPYEVVYQTIVMEAGDQSFEGQVAVAEVILNRVIKSPIKGQKEAFLDVCLAPKQFSCWNDRKKSKRWLAKHYTAKARQIASNALEMATLEYVGHGYTHYHTVGCYPSWAKGYKGVRIEDHVFYRGIA